MPPSPAQIGAKYVHAAVYRLREAGLTAYPTMRPGGTDFAQGSGERDLKVRVRGRIWNGEVKLKKEGWKTLGDKLGKAEFVYLFGFKDEPLVLTTASIWEELLHECELSKMDRTRR